jgi:hypothetical protein
MLLDPPSVTGLPPGQISGIAIPRHRRPILIAIAVAAALALSVLTGITVALHSAGGPGRAPIITMIPPFPSLADGHRPEPTTSPHGTAPTSGAMPRPSTTPVTTAPPTASPGTISPGTMASQPTVTVTYLVVSGGTADSRAKSGSSIPASMRSRAGR